MNTTPAANGAHTTDRPRNTGRRARRGRIIVLGDGSLIESIARATNRPTTLAHHVYDVIGDLVQTGILDAPDAIVASVQALGARAAAFVDVVRRIDPSVQLVAIADGGSRSGEPTHAFDQTLPAPFDAIALEQAISGELKESRGLQDSHDWRKSHDGQDAHDSPDSLPPLIEVPATPQRHREPAAHTAPPAQLHSAPRAPLGDVDLVRAIMDDPEQVAALALQLVEQETGWRDLRIDTAPPDAAAGARICWPGSGPRRHPISYGFLIAPTAPAMAPTAPTAAPTSPTAAPTSPAASPSAEQLAPWADWLAHWLHLAQSTADLREKAYTDQLTGACNRRFFEADLHRALEDARTQRQCVSVLLFDIDDFKKYNDRNGHAAGDEILIETVKLLRSVIRPTDRVCRIGGDEFVVIFHDPQGQRERGSSHPHDIQKIARRFQQQICRHRFPKLSEEARDTLTISGGLATFPWDGADVASLLEQADRNAMQSKRSGKNAITFGPGVSDVGAAEESSPPPTNL